MPEDMKELFGSASGTRSERRSWRWSEEDTDERQDATAANTTNPSWSR